MAATVSASDLERRIGAGDMRALARAATLIEAQTEVGRELIASLFPKTGRALLVGITGPPGAGKSTLVDQLAKVLRRSGQTVGIVAVDPSSPFTQGAILGDRIRMQDHHDDPGVFIRSMASRGKLGGIAKGTLEMALLMDAAGRGVVIIETVGVGQDEIEVARLADETVLVLAPGQGDDVQAIKAGIMEAAGVFAINKSDMPGAERLEQEIRAMQSLGTEQQRLNAVPIRRVIATQGDGVEDLWSVIRSVSEKHGRRGACSETWAARLREMLRDQLLAALPEDQVQAHAERVAARTEDPYQAVEALRLSLTAKGQP